MKNLNDAAGAFIAGGIAGGMGYGKGKATIGKAAALWGGLNRTAQKQALRRFGNVSQKMINAAYKEVREGVQENIYRQILKKYGIEAIVSGFVSAISTEGVSSIIKWFISRFYPFLLL